MKKKIQNRKYKIELQKKVDLLSNFYFLLSNKPASSGFVLLFTVLVSSLILSIALGMTSLAYRETSLNIVAKNSQYALFAADSAAECALNHLLRADNNPFVGWPLEVTISCGGHNLVATNANGDGGEPNYIFNFDPQLNALSGTTLPKGCGIPRIYQPSGSEVLRVQGIGYNLTCPALFALTNPTQRVERAIEYTFLLTGGDGGLGNGNPISGGQTLNVNLFDPGSINTDLLGSFNPNQQSGVLGNTQDSGFFGTLYSGILDLFGITTIDQNSGGGGTGSLNPYDGSLDGMINSNGGLNPSDTGKLTSDGQGNLYVNDNGNLGTLGNSGTNLNTDKTDSLGTATGGIRIINNSPLDQGMIKETNPVDSWFSQFSSDGTTIGNSGTGRITTPPDTKLNTTKTLDGLLTAPDGTLSLAQEPTSRNIELAQVVIDRYGKAIGDAKLASQINPEILVKVASTMSFPDGPITYDTAKKLIYNYGQAIGNSNFYSQFDYTTLAQVMDDVRLDYSVPASNTQKQIQTSSSILDSAKAFFYDLLGISTTREQASLVPEIQGSDIAKIVLQQYAVQSGSSAITEKIDPEVLAAIGEKYDIGSNGLTPDVAKEILVTYGETVGDTKIASQIDSDLFAQVVDGVLQKAATLSQDTITMTRVTPEMVKSLGQVYVQNIGDPAGASWIDTNRFTDMLNVAVPTTGVVTPKIAKLFLEKYAQAVGDTKLTEKVSILPLTDFMNRIIGASGNRAALLAVDTAIETSSKNSDTGAPPEAIQMIFDAYAQAVGNTDVYNAIDPVKFSEITKELPQNDGPVTSEIAKMAVEKYATSIGNLKLVDQVDYEVLAKTANNVVDQYKEANTKIADTRIVQPALSITPDIAKKLIEVYAQSFGDKTSLETINPDLLAEAINSSVLVDQPNAEVAKAVLDRYSQLADSKYPDIDAEIFAKYLGGLSPTRLLIQEAPVRYYQTGLGVADIVALPADVSFGTRVKIALASLFGADQTVQKLSIANLSPQVSDIKALQETQTTSSEISTIADVDSISSLASEQMRVLTVRSITEVKRNIIVRFVNMLSFIFGNSRGIVLPIEKAPLIQTAVDTASIEQKQQEVLQLFR